VTGQWYLGSRQGHKQFPDRVVFFKLVLVGRLEKLISDRRLVEHCALRLDILFFLGYEIDEDLPWHSTIRRTRQLYPAAVFEHLFEQVFAQCVAAGLVVGQTPALDSAPVKANASLDSLRPKQPTPALRVVDDTKAPAPLPAATTTPAHELRRVATRQAQQQRGGGGLGAHHAKPQLLSNKTHTSGSDPEARISVKPGKARALNYLCSLAVDTATGLISHVQADLADSRDSVPSATQKKLVRAPYDAAYLRAWQCQQRGAGQRRRRMRQGTVEPVFSNLLHHYGLRRVNTKGQAAAHKTMLLTAIAYNLKKLLRHQPKRVVSVALAYQLGPYQLAQRPFFWLRASRLPACKLRGQENPTQRRVLQQLRSIAGGCNTPYASASGKRAPKWPTS
jgi:IS5 family transposase